MPTLPAIQASTSGRRFECAMPVLVNALPSSREMHVRLDWIGALIDRESDGEELILVPQADVLFDEMSRSFASGAWLSAIVFAQAMLDVELNQGNIDGLMQNLVRFGPDYVWLRNRRNHLLHADTPSPAVTVSDLKQDAGRLEQEARRAIALAVKAVSAR